MRIKLCRRHVRACDHKDNPQYTRCTCPVWFQTNENGQQDRWSSKETDWTKAGRLARRLEDEADKGKDIHAGGKPVLDAILDFLRAKNTIITKRGTLITEDALDRYAYFLGVTWNRETKTGEPISGGLLGYCNANAIRFVKDIKLVDIERLQASWNRQTLFSIRNAQEKIKPFFKYCLRHEYIFKNPMADWKLAPMPQKDDLEITEEQIIRPKEYAKIMAAIDQVDMTPENRLKVKACMRLQYASGVAIVDAVMMHKNELVKENGRYRFKSDRQKTRRRFNNIISDELAQLLLTVKNGNPEYFFWSGKTLPEDEPSYFHKLYRKVFKAAGVNHTSHDFRHTYAVRFLEAGNPLDRLAFALADTPDVVRKHYAHFTKQQQRLNDEAQLKALAAMTDF